MDIAQKVTLGERQMDQISKFLLHPNILKRSETYYQHKHKFVSTSLEIGSAFNSDQT